MKLPPPRISLQGLSAVKVGLHRYTFDDPYYLVLSMSWPAFLIAVLGMFVSANLVFATLYWLAPDAVANVPPGNFLRAFFFSVETFATVGYGVMTPNTTYGHAVATAEMFAGMFLTALATGAFFARFARPKPKFLFSEVAVIAPYEGGQALMLRVASGRLQGISEASARIVYLSEHLVGEARFRRFNELKLVRSNLPVLSLSWTLIHPVNEESPLWEMTPERVEAEAPALMVAVTGYDESISAQVTDRKTYRAPDVRIGHIFVDIIRDLPNGFIELDLTRIHLTEPAGPVSAEVQIQESAVRAS